LLKPTEESFDETLIESIDEALQSLFSQQVVDAFHQNLKTKRSLGEDDLPANLEVVSAVLEKYFGEGAHTIENTIARRLYSKWGLEFQRSHDGRLTEYVANVRTKIQPVAGTDTPEPTHANIPLPLKDDFDGLLIESIKEAIEEVVGKDSASMALRVLEHSVPFDKLPHHLPAFYGVLKKTFGKDSPIVEIAIARKLYQKLQLDFSETPPADLSRYVETAYAKVVRREQQGLFNFSIRPAAG